MTWLRLQWRGALVALVAWAGLAAAQSSGPQSSPYLPTIPTPTLPPASAAGSQLPPIKSVTNLPTPAATNATPVQRVVTLKENGKSIRCHIVQTWLQADGSTAHQLKALDTGEFITIVDDTAVPRTTGRGLPMRIFHWGLRNRVAPPGIPSPPMPTQLAVDSGVSRTREINPPPPGRIALNGPAGASGAGSPYTFGMPGGPTAPLPPQLPAPTPYRFGAPRGTTAPSIAANSTPVGPALPARTANGCDACAANGTNGGSSCGGCLPDPMLVQSGTVCPAPKPALSLREKVQSWFARKSSTVSIVPGSMQSAEPPTVASAASSVPAATSRFGVQQPGLAIVAPPCVPPCSAQPSQAEIVAPGPGTDIVRGAIKVATDTTGKPFIGMPDPGGPAPVAVAKTANAGTTVASAKPGDDDVLISPERFMPDRNRMRIKGLIVSPSAPIATPTAIVRPTATAPAVSTATPTTTGLPPGAASVIAARNGLDGPVAYVPIQPVVVPKPWRPPVPPDPKLPEAPQLNQFVNAFTPPAPPRGAGGPQAMNGFGPMMPYPPAMAYGYGPGMGMMPPYGMNPYAMMNPYLSQGMPYGYYPMPPTAMDPRRRYQGPMPPDPFHTNAPPAIQPAGYYPVPTAYPQYPSGQPLQTVGYTEQAPAAAPVAQPAPAPQLGQLMDLLRNSPYPAQRELAAGYLASCDWRTNPDIVTALIAEAKIDPAPTVRAGCVTNLMRMSVATAAYRAMLEELRTDADPRVRDAVDAAIGRLGQVQTTTRAN